MKRLGMVVAMVAVMAVAACGGSGSSGSSTAKAAADNSIVGFSNIVDSILTCVPTGTPPSCACSGGGSIVLTGGTLSASATKAASTIEADNCTDAATGLVYDGTLNVDLATGDASFNFPVFGECSSVTGSAEVGTDTCNGSVNGTCAGETINCNVTDGSGDDCVCG